MDVKRIQPDAGLAERLMNDLALLAEPSFKEYKTTEYIVAFLKKTGINPSHIFETGCYGTLDFGAEKTVAFRSDIDALPANPDKTEYKHLCGHHHNMTALLLLLEAVQRSEVKPKVNIRYIFQPAEEIVSGAKFMIEKGCLDGVDCIFAAHAENEIAMGKLGVKSGPCMAGSHHIALTFTGKATHAAMPHLGNDVITAAADYITKAQMIVSRLKDPILPGLISFGSIHGGSADNIIPDKLELKGTFRYFHSEVKDTIEKGMESLASGIEELYGVKIEIDIKDGTHPVINDPALAAFICDIADENSLPRVPFDKASLGGEDFSEYVRLVKGVFVWTGANEHGNHPPLHSGDFYVPTPTVVASADMWIKLAYSIDRYFG